MTRLEMVKQLADVVTRPVDDYMHQPVEPVLHEPIRVPEVSELFVWFEDTSPASATAACAVPPACPSRCCPGRRTPT